MKKPNAFSPLYIILLILGLSVGFGVAYIFFNPAKNDETVVNVTPEISEEMPGWTTYVNEDAGFSFKYPSNIALNEDTKGAEEMVLNIAVQKLSDIPEDLPFFGGRNYALEEKARLEKGEGDNIIKVGSLNAQVTMTFTHLEVCGVYFIRTLTFYPGEYKVVLSLNGPKNKIIESMPEFFKVDSANCGTNKSWDLDKVSDFGNTLAQRNGKGISQEWFNTFDSIVKTIVINKSSEVPSSQKITDMLPVSDIPTYKNIKYGFQMTYPSAYKLLEDSDSLSGWKNGIALFYAGGQSYDVVVQVWDSQAQIDQEFTVNNKNVTVTKIGTKYISLLDVTNEPENKLIIDSFKVL